MFCLTTKYVNEFLKRLKSGKIDPQKLAEMSSEERRTFFSEFLGEKNAKEVNANFESKLLLKDQQQGMINWAKKTAGLKPEVRKDIISRIEKMSEVLNPDTEKAFLEDLAAHKLGVTVSMNEASQISDMAKTVSENKLKIPQDSPVQSKERMAYGRALIDFGDYISDLKNEAKKTTFQDFKNNPLQMRFFNI